MASRWPRRRFCSACPAASACPLGNKCGESAQGLFCSATAWRSWSPLSRRAFNLLGPLCTPTTAREQERIGRVHDVLNLLIFGFFCVLVMFEDIVFLIFPNKKSA